MIAKRPSSATAVSLDSVSRRKLRSLRFAIVAARFNPELTDALLEATRKTLARCGVGHVDTLRVPGSYEVPMVVGQLARKRKYAAIVALGVILQGETLHAEHIGMASTVNLQRIAIETGVPVIHQILTPRKPADARRRVHLRGVEAGQAAIEMALLMRRLR
jgi:6,7-dimethyl-8-ribityllumazine synthase